jgi:3-oxoacyl-[acyl-carrier-protein] synthase-1
VNPETINDHGAMLTPFVTAYTVTCAAGTGIEAFHDSLRRECTGLRRNDFPHCNLDTWIGRVAGVEDAHLPPHLADRECRNNRLAWLGLAQDGFIDAVQGAIARYGAGRVACITGTSTAGISATEAAYRERRSDGHLREEYRLPRVHTPHTSSAFIADCLGVQGPVYTLSTACSSSAKVFASAARLIELGWIDAAVVGGVDSLCLTVLYGFHSLDLVSPAPCQPFDRNRRGLNLGEAAGFALLERDAAAPRARLIGCGESSDAWHMAAPHPDGIGAQASMRAALDAAGIAGEEVGYINLHGTATRLNDAVEAKVVGALCPGVPASSTKGWTGHTLGAAGIVEAVVCLLALERGFLPGTLNCADAEDEPAALLTSGAQRTVETAMSNSFGFGGNNCSLIFARA